ncbi:MAG: thiamine pyrophosphate-binding protein, partial [Lachnospiraceae bacterium]|nr:thiamine pyrophosphate-binding protein [Lachnospiraceae bacterium]
MKVKVSEYIADFLADRGATDVFVITGGGAMHLDDAIGHNERIKCTYNHHEQACAIAAEGYAR